MVQLRKKRSPKLSKRGMRLLWTIEHQDPRPNGIGASSTMAPKGHSFKGIQVFKDACLSGTQLEVCLESLGNLKKYSQTQTQCSH